MRKQQIMFLKLNTEIFGSKGKDEPFLSFHISIHFLSKQTKNKQESHKINLSHLHSNFSSFTKKKKKKKKEPP